MHKYIWLIAFVIFFSCGKKSNSEKSDNDSVLVVKQSLPVNYEFAQGNDNIESKKILIVVIDPHGDGKLAVAKFQKVIENFNCTVIGLNDVKNGQQDFMQRISNDIKSATEHLELSLEQIYFAGFSGGGQMAFNYGNSISANGVLMCGIGGLKEISMSEAVPLALIIGTKDFNFLNQYYSPYSDIVYNENFINFVFDGIHEWPNEDYILYAFSFLLAKNNIDLPVEINKDDLLKKYEIEKNYFLAFKTLECVYKLTKNEKNNDELKKMLINADFKNYITNFEHFLNEESIRDGDYVELLNVKNIDWWKSEIGEINQFSKFSDAIKADSYSRTKAFLGILMFSYVAVEIENVNSEYIDKYLEIYELLEPENADLWFFKALRQKQLGDIQNSKDFLNKAFEFGYTDSLKAHQKGLI
ncbi:MAG: hypothetical protein JXL97_03140 [Bacteroidales bacterium]|nr:hypothetical protein [Bacteroidales bacterium]